MATQGGTTDDGRGERPGDSNVVPFPGDWIGPRDELVPVGRASSRAGPMAGESNSTAPAAGPLAREDAIPPFAPDAFWSEHSDEIHDVLKAPASHPDATGPAAIPDSRRRRRAVRLPALRDRGRPAFGTAATVTSVAVVCAVAVLSSFEGASRPHRYAIARVGRPASGAVAPGVGGVAGPRPPRPSPLPLVVARHAPRPHAARARPAHNHVRQRQAVSSGVLVSSSVSPPSGGGQAGSSNSAPPSSGAASGDTAVNSTPPAGPIGAGAAFGPGHFG